MNRLRAIYLLALLISLVAISCSSGGEIPITPPITPDTDSQLSAFTRAKADTNAQIHVWGYYDVYFDFENRTIEAVPNRDVMFAANVVHFLNQNPANIEFVVNDTPVGNGYVDADFDVSLTHPLPEMPEYDGYDVRGVFIGNGSSTLNYNSALKCVNEGTEQNLVNADGYTRWFNPAEFTTSGVLGYTTGIFAIPGYTGTATLNSYKYFADSLGATDDLWTWLNANPGTNSVFTSGSTNTRNYYIHFPIPPGVKYGYAVLASWEGEELEDHPANAPEAIACSIVDNSDLSYTSPTKIEGELVLDISLFGWTGKPSTIFLDSPNLNQAYELTSEMTPTGGTSSYSTYHVEIPGFLAQGSSSDELWVIAEYDAYDYTNEYGVENDADTDKLAAYFRHDLGIENPYTGWAVDFTTDTGWDVAVDHEGNVYMAGHNGYLAKYSPGGELLWDNPNIYGNRMGVDVDSAGNVYISGGEVSYGFLSKYSPDGELQWVKDEDGMGFIRSLAADSDGNVYIAGQGLSSYGFDPGNGEPIPNNGDVFVLGYDSDGNFRWGKTWGDPGYGQGHAVTIDESSGNVYVTGRYYGSNFNPGDGSSVDFKGGNYDVFLTTFDSTGNCLWARTFGGDGWDESRGVAVDNGKIYVMGSFNSSDFDPGDGSSVATKGWLDLFVTAFDSNGVFQWTKIWGGKHDDRSWGIEVGGSGNISVSGFFQSTDFDPGNGSSVSTNGGSDVFLSTFDSNGNYQWAHTFGGIYEDWGRGVDVDSAGNVYTTGQFKGPVDIAPTGAPCYEEPDIHDVGGYGGYVIKYLSDGCW